MCSVCSLLTQPLWHCCTSSNLHQNSHFGHGGRTASQAGQCGTAAGTHEFALVLFFHIEPRQPKPMRLHRIPAVLDSLKTKQQHSSKGSWETWQASCETGSVDTRVTGWWESDAIWQSAGLTSELMSSDNLSLLCTDACNVSQLRDERWRSGPL